jgi:FkbM family methyltransferase
MMKQLIKKGIVTGLWHTLGRKDLVRLARFLSNESRLDTANNMDSNGELLVQRTVLDQLLNNGPGVVFDVGANVGEWTKSLYAQSHGAANFQTHAFEPCQQTHETLRANLEQWGLTSQVIPAQVALSSAPGQRSFYSYGSNVGRNSLHPASDVAQQSVETVALETLDQYCRHQEISRIHLMKIDTEGHDLEVIYGGQEMLQKNRIDALQFEYNWRWIDSRHYLKDAFTFFGPLGYTLGKVTPLGIEFYDQWHFELETFREANFLAARKDLAAHFPQVEWWNAAAA